MTTTTVPSEEIFSRGPKASVKTERDPIIEAIFSGMTSTNTLRRKRMYGAAAGKCSRHSYLMTKTDGTDTFGPSGSMYTAIGTAVHNMISTALFNAGLLMFKEYRLSPPTWLSLSGYVDDIIAIDGQPAILEIKTTGNSSKATIDFDHAMQATTYALITGIDRAFVLYVDRNVGMPLPKMRSLQVDTSPMMLRAVATQLANGQVGLNRDRLPHIPLSLRPSLCRYCPFHANCWDDEPFTYPVGEALGGPDDLRDVEWMVADLIDPKQREWRLERTLEFITKFGEKRPIPELIESV